MECGQLVGENTELAPFIYTIIQVQAVSSAFTAPGSLQPRPSWSLENIDPLLSFIYTIGRLWVKAYESCVSNQVVVHSKSSDTPQY